MLTLFTPKLKSKIVHHPMCEQALFHWKLLCVGAWEKQWKGAVTTVRKRKSLTRQGWPGVTWGELNSAFPFIERPLIISLVHDLSRKFEAADASDESSDLDDQTDAKTPHKYQSKKSSHSKVKNSGKGKKDKKKMEVAVVTPDQCTKSKAQRGWDSQYRSMYLPGSLSVWTW